MNENILCSIAFQFEVPGGKWQTVTSSPASAANAANSTYLFAARLTANHSGGQMVKRFLAAIAAGVLAAVTFAAAPAQAVSLEINYTTGSGITIELPCSTVDDPSSSLTAGTGCFQSEGDIFDVEDNLADGHSVAVRWYNYYQGSLYRQGACVESRAAGSEGICNKNFHEGSTIVFKVCLWESATDTQLGCGSSGSWPA